MATAPGRGRGRGARGQNAGAGGRGRAARGPGPGPGPGGGMRRGGGRRGRAARGGAGLCAAVLLGAGASAAGAAELSVIFVAQDTPERCSAANLEGAFLRVFSACEASEGSPSAGCCEAVEGFTAESTTGAADCLCYQDVYDRLKALVTDLGRKVFFIDDIVEGCSANFGVKVGTPNNYCFAGQPEPADGPEPEPLPAPGTAEPLTPPGEPGWLSCSGKRKKACRQTAGDCFFFKRACLPTLRNGADPSDCGLLARRPKACRAAGCQFAGRRKRGSCSAPPTAASEEDGLPDLVHPRP